MTSFKAKTRSTAWGSLVESPVCPRTLFEGLNKGVVRGVGGINCSIEVGTYLLSLVFGEDHLWGVLSLGGTVPL